MSRERDLNLQHLQAELARLDIRIQREVVRWHLAGQDSEDAFRGLKIGDEEAHNLLARPFATSWGQTVDLGPDAQPFADAEHAAEQEVEALQRQAADLGQPLRLSLLAKAFDLDRFDLDALLICLAPHLDLRYERLYGYLQDDVTRRRPTVNLILDLLCEPGPERLRQLVRFADDAPLLRHQLLERAAEAGPVQPTLLGQSLVCDEAVVSWLLGDYRPSSDLAAHLSLAQPQPGRTEQVLAGDHWPALQHAVTGQAQPPVVVFYGVDQAGQRATAHLLAGAVQRPLLAVELDRLLGPDRPAVSVLRRVLRDARLNGAVPLILGWDACLAPDPAGGLPLSDALAEVCRYPGLAVIAGQMPWQAKGIDRERHLLWLEFGTPDYRHRHALWEHALQEVQASLPVQLELGPADLDLLAGQFVLTAAQIREAAASAKDWALQRGGRLEREDLFHAARSHSSPGLSSLAHKIEVRYRWNDIVLPDDQLAMLHEIIDTVRGRPTVLESWGVGQKLASSAGVSILFAGPPGTGKTMAAEVVAAELGLDLYKIDLSTVVNKYIGETEKNLSRIFDEAASSNAILFFDEADAIFGKRSEVKDAHDRYANIEVSYLLQRMETYAGVTILATNLRANLDEAFSRRLQFAIDFPFPDEAYRLRIWQALFPPDVPRAPDLDLGLLARRFKLAGGNIRNIIISAAYLAAADGGVVRMPHLLHGARRELQKMGRLIKDKEDTFH